MNNELFFMISGVALVIGSFAVVLAWATILKFDEHSRRVDEAFKLISEHETKLNNSTAVNLSLDKGLVLFAQKLYQQEEALNSLKEDLVTQKQVAALVHDAINREAN